MTTEPTPNPVSPPAPAPAPSPAPSPSPSPGSAGRPEGLAEQFWDAQANSVNVKAIGELATFKQQHDERLAALPKAAADYKIEIKLPDTVKLPEGFNPEINKDDPRIPIVQAFAHKYQLPQEALNELVALDAQMQIADFAAAGEAVQAEMKKLGENGKARTDAADAWLKANVKPDEYAAMRLFIGNASAFTGLEKLIALAVKQGVPPNGGGAPPQPPKPAEIPIEQRWYGNGAQPRAN